MATAMAPQHAGKGVMHAVCMGVVLKGGDADPIVAIGCDDVPIRAIMGCGKDTLAIILKGGRLPPDGRGIIGGTTAVQFIMLSLYLWCHSNIGQREEADACVLDSFDTSVEALFIKRGDIEPGDQDVAGNVKMTMLCEL
jgi:hypothetical protein